MPMSKPALNAHYDTSNGGGEYGYDTAAPPQALGGRNLKRKHHTLRESQEVGGLRV